MSVLVSADWHFSDNPRDAYRHEFQKQLRAIVKADKVDVVLVLGDLTEEKDRHGSWLVNTIVDHIYQLSQLCVVVFIRGNHDATDPTHPFYGFVNRMPNVHWLNQPTEGKDLHIPALDETLGRTLFLPHTDDYERDWAPFEFENFDWVFAHATFEGAHVGHGVTLPGIPKEIFPGTVEVVSGDIHIPQEIGNITYVGAPYLVDFGDDYEPRVLLLTGDDVVSIPVKGAQKRLVELSGITKLGKLKQKLNPGDIVKVRVDLDTAQLGDWPTIQAKVREWGREQGLVVHAVQAMVDKSQRMSPSSRKSRMHKSDAELVQEYGERMGFDATTIKTGLRLAQTA